MPLEAVGVDPELADVVAQGCARCGGHWLEGDDLKRLEQVVEVTWVEHRHIPPPAVQQAPLSCPRCHPPRVMVKLQSPRDRKVVMDGCPACRGVWLDGGELRAIRQKGVGAALVDALKLLLRS